MPNFISLLYSMTDNTTHGLEIAKQNARDLYKLAKKAVLDTGKNPRDLADSQLWANYTEAKKICQFLGVRI